MLLQIHEKVNVILLHLFSIPSNKNLISFLSCRLHPDYFWIYANLILELKFPTCLFPNSSFILVFSILHERTLNLEVVWLLTKWKKTYKIIFIRHDLLLPLVPSGKPFPQATPFTPKQSNFKH